MNAYSVDFFHSNGWIELRALTAHQRERLYVLMPWRVILLDQRIRETYQEFFAVSLMKALFLPYLIPIASECALAKELHERELLQAICGFVRGAVPSHATLWHFRRKYADAYAELMLQLLIAAVLVRPEPDYGLPFVTPLPENADTLSGQYARWRHRFHEPAIEVWMTDANVGAAPVSAKGRTWLEIKWELSVYGARNKRGIAKSLGLPAEIRTTTARGQTIRFGIDQPYWPYSRRQQGDALTTIGPAASKPYIACHVLVVQTNGVQREILLGKRLVGYAKGAYMWPGGEQGREESLLECAARELREETGLRFLKGRPVSMHRDRLPGKPPVQSVGVLAEAYEGTIRNREPDQKADWEWFDLNRLPPLLFEPARRMIMQWLKRHLSWTQLGRSRISDPGTRTRVATRLAIPCLIEAGDRNHGAWAVDPPTDAESRYSPSLEVRVFIAEEFHDGYLDRHRGKAPRRSNSLNRDPGGKKHAILR